jgi:hypothetical protein
MSQKKKVPMNSACFPATRTPIAGPHHVKLNGTDDGRLHQTSASLSSSTSIAGCLYFPLTLYDFSRDRGIHLIPLARYSDRTVNIYMYRGVK